MANLSTNLPLPLMQTKWAAQLNPVLANPLNNVQILKNISLSAGNNVINHGLPNTQQGWIIVDIQSAAKIYRSAPFNNLTLTLNSDIPTTVSIGVF